MRRAFAWAELIVAKGQGNFETMNEMTEFPIAFLFLALPLDHDQAAIQPPEPVQRSHGLFQMLDRVRSPRAFQRLIQHLGGLRFAVDVQFDTRRRIGQREFASACQFIRNLLLLDGDSAADAFQERRGHDTNAI